MPMGDVEHWAQLPQYRLLSHKVGQHLAVFIKFSSSACNAGGITLSKPASPYLSMLLEIILKGGLPCVCMESSNDLAS